METLGIIIITLTSLSLIVCIYVLKLVIKDMFETKNRVALNFSYLMTFFILMLIILLLFGIKLSTGFNLFY